MRQGAKVNAIKTAISNTTAAAPKPKPSENENGFSGGGPAGAAGGVTDGTEGNGFGGLAIAAA